MNKYWLYGLVAFSMLLLMTACGGSDDDDEPKTATGYTIGGQVSGLTGDVLVIQNNGGDDLTITDNGDFTFNTRQSDGASYNVTITTQPAGQICTVINDSGTVNRNDVSNILIGCPFVPVTPSVAASGHKLLRFAWNDVGAAYYRLLKNPDGASGYTPLSGEIAATQFEESIPVHLTDWLNASYIVSACNNASECVDSDPFSPASEMLDAIGYLKAYDGTTGNTHFEWQDWFGESVALSGDGSILAVGAIGSDPSADGVHTEPDDSLSWQNGVIYLFVREDGIWHQTANITASNSDITDRFGAALALSDDGATLAVGAPGESSAATEIDGDQTDNSAPSSGAVYLFKYDGDSWTQETYIKGSNSTSEDRFGGVLSLSQDGNTLAVSARESVYLFTYNNLNWSEQTRLTASREESNESFGEALQLAGDGTTLAVGAPYESSAIGLPENSGVVYLFVKEGDNWSEQAYLKASNGEYADQFGNSLSISGSGDILAVGAEHESSSATGINGDSNDNSANHAGAVYLFERRETSWQQTTYLKASNTGSNDRFGHRVVISEDGETLAVSAAGEDSIARGIGGDQTDNSAQEPPGAVYLFRYRDNGWYQHAYVKASNTDEGYIDSLDYMSCRPDQCWLNDDFGSSLAISNDGATLVVGAPGEASGNPADPEDNSEQESGAVYLY
jgi:hypothetical protein